MESIQPHLQCILGASINQNLLVRLNVSAILTPFPKCYASPVSSPNVQSCCSQQVFGVPCQCVTTNRRFPCAVLRRTGAEAAQCQYSPLRGELWDGVAHTTLPGGELLDVNGRVSEWTACQVTLRAAVNQAR